ncbi:tripartite tricarboxylate transporter permease [Candidatus Pacearchaeota archaeon]|nr:tripartite tricarboxylate transporter permease [Candidatus Pacearchaeota archaeon]
MLIELIGFLLLGILMGIITGLIPGIHINLIGTILISLSATIFLTINPIFLVVFIVAMAITHTFLDFIPSIFLGCPDTDTELSVLPGHDLLKKGLAYEAISLTTYGSLSAVIILIIIAFPSMFIISKIYDFILSVLPYLLIGISIILISLEKKKYSALFVFLLTGFLGLSVLNLNAQEPLLPLLTGLFGSSMLVQSIKNKTKIPPQIISKPKLKLMKPLLGAIIASPICSFLPGLGSGQAAIIGNTISKTGRKGFLVLIGATNTLVMGFSFISLYLISRTRTGAAVAISEIMGTVSLNLLILILICTLITGIISFFITINLAKILANKMNKVDYKKLSLTTLFILILIVYLVSNFLGLLIFLVSTFTGIYCISLNVKRTNMMGCLLIPTIIFYLFI